MSEATNKKRLADRPPIGCSSFRAWLEKHLEAVQQVNVEYNALVDVFADDALGQAQCLDDKRARGELLGPLAGMTVSVKANIDVAGHASTHGIRPLKQNIVHRDAPLVERLRDADAIIMAHANMPDMSMRFHTSSQLYGATRSYFDSSLTPGGSSGGDAVSVAAGMTAIGLGNDAGGSVRIPAAFAGVCSLKPTTGRFASDRSMGRDLPFAAQVIPVDGLIAQNVDDLVNVYRVVAGSDARDPRSVPVGVEYATRMHKRVALVRDPGNRGVAASVCAAITRAQEALIDAGFEVVECQPPALDKSLELYGRLIMTEFGQSWPILSKLVGDDVRKYLEYGLTKIQALTLPEYISAIAERMQVQRQWASLFTEYDALLGPVFCDSIPRVDADIVSKESNEAIGRAMRLCSASSLAGCPAVSISVPAADGLPVGLQFICAYFEESKALTIAGEVERRLLRHH